MEDVFNYCRRKVQGYQTIISSGANNFLTLKTGITMNVTRSKKIGVVLCLTIEKSLSVSSRCTKNTLSSFSRMSQLGCKGRSNPESEGATGRYCQIQIPFRNQLKDSVDTGCLNLDIFFKCRYLFVVNFYITPTIFFYHSVP